MTLGERVRQLRERNGWTQRELAAKYGTKQGYITRLEGNGVSPTQETVERLAEVFGLSLQEFIGPVGTQADERFDKATALLDVLVQRWGLLPADAADVAAYAEFKRVQSSARAGAEDESDASLGYHPDKPRPIAP